MLDPNALPLHGQGLKGAFAQQHISLRTEILLKVADVAPIAFRYITFDAHIRFEHFGEKIHAEIIFHILWDHLYRFRRK